MWDYNGTQKITYWERSVIDFIFDIMNYFQNVYQFINRIYDEIKKNILILLEKSFADVLFNFSSWIISCLIDISLFWKKVTNYLAENVEIKQIFDESLAWFKSQLWNKLVCIFCILGQTSSKIQSAEFCYN